MFPTPQLWSQTQNYYEFKSIADAQHWNSVFQPIYQIMDLAQACLK